MFTLDLISLTVIALVILVAGVVHSAIGFGFGIISLGVLSALPSIIDARDTHVMMSMCSIPMLLMATWAYRDGIDWPSLRPALIGAAIMMPVGVFAFSSMSLDLLIRGTGLAILLMTCLGLRNQSVKVVESTQRGSPLSSLIAGAISGLLGGAVSIAGPPVATYALNQGWPPERFKAFVTQCLLVISIYKTIGLAVAGLITPVTVGQAAWATPFAIVGIQIGVIISRKIDPKEFQVIVALVLICVACLLMYRGQP